jgi:hypothetical protein
MWKLISPFVPEATRKKTGIFRKGFLPELLKVIDIDVLPPCYGGTEGGRGNVFYSVLPFLLLGLT